MLDAEVDTRNFIFNRGILCYRSTSHTNGYCYFRSLTSIRCIAAEIDPIVFSGTVVSTTKVCYVCFEN